MTHGSLPGVRRSRRLDQILDNLLSNAVRYGDPDSDVTVDLERAPDGVAVAVTNVGPGIAAEDLPRLFQPFGRDVSAAHWTESVGLELYAFRFVLPAAA